MCGILKVDCWWSNDRRQCWFPGGSAPLLSSPCVQARTCPDQAQIGRMPQRGSGRQVRSHEGQGKQRHGFREVHRSGQGLPAVGAGAGAARRPSAVPARAPAQGAAGRSRRHGREPDPGGGRQRQARRSRRSRSCSGSSPRSRAAAPASSTWRRRPRGCSTRPSRSRRSPATPSSPSSSCCWRWP